MTAGKSCAQPFSRFPSPLFSPSEHFWSQRGKEKAPSLVSQKSTRAGPRNSTFGGNSCPSPVFSGHQRHSGGCPRAFYGRMTRAFAGSECGRHKYAPTWLLSLFCIVSFYYNFRPFLLLYQPLFTYFSFPFPQFPWDARLESDQSPKSREELSTRK